MAGRPKTRAKWEAEAEDAGIPYEEYKAMKIAEHKEAGAQKVEEKLKKREEAKTLRDSMKLKRSELSEWTVRFVSRNMKQYGQAIMDQLAADDPKAAATFLSQLMKFAAPTAADQEKKGDGTDNRQENAEYKDAMDRINKMKKQFEKNQ